MATVKIATMLETCFAFCAIALSVCLYFKISFNYWKKHGVVYLPPTVPFGNFKDLVFKTDSIGNILTRIYEKAKANGCSFGGMYCLSEPILVPVGLDVIKNIMGKDFQYFMHRGVYIDEKQEPTSANLFALGGMKWKNLRSKLSPTFTIGKTKSMFPILSFYCEELKAYMEEAIEKNEAIDIKEVYSRFSLDVIASCAFGLQCNSLKDPDNEFRRYTKRVFEYSKFIDMFRRTCFVAMPKLLSLLKITSADTETTDFYTNTVKNAVYHREKNRVNRNDFLQTLIQLKNSQDPSAQLTMEEVVAQCIVFFQAGFETSSTAMTLSLFEIIANPTIEEKLRNEISKVLHKHGGRITYEALLEMSYLEQVILETTRKYPPAPILTRQCSRDYRIPGTTYTIKKGQRIFVPVLAIHRDPDIYPDPLKFDPDRFKDGGINIQPYTQLAFGEGPRLCIGKRFGMMQTKAGLVTLLSNYKLTLNEMSPKSVTINPKSNLMATEGTIWLDAKKL